MKAIILNEFGGPEVLLMGEVEMREPGPGEISIEVAYAGMNPADWKDREGHVARFTNPDFPYVLGFDVAGIVADVGADVTRFQRGDRVFACSNHGQGASGSYAEFTLSTENRAALLPPSMEFKAGAALPVAALTAWQALHDHGALVAGQRVLVNGASGGVGSFAVQFARYAGAEVGSICSKRNLDYVQQLGAQTCFDYGSDGVSAALREWASDGLDLIIDAVGFGTLEDPVALLRPGGKLVSIATLLGDGDIEGDAKAAAELGREKIFAIMSDAESGEQLKQIAALLADGSISLPPIEVFSMDRAGAAHAELETGHVRGKLVLEIGGE
ncbi:MAG: NADP-dependent oxidoreductase, partial [Myxococcota bacterium]